MIINISGSKIIILMILLSFEVWGQSEVIVPETMLTETVNPKNKVDFYFSGFGGQFINYSNGTLPDGSFFVYNTTEKVDPLGLRFSHHFRDKFSLGLDVMYSKKTSKGYVLNPAEGQRDISLVNQRLRIQLRAMYHFSSPIPVLDFYVGGAIGSNSNILKYIRDGVERPVAESGVTTFPVPVSLKVYTGVSYHVFKGLGFNSEFSIGGPLFTFGLSYRF